MFKITSLNFGHYDNIKIGVHYTLYVRFIVVNHNLYLINPAFYWATNNERGPAAFVKPFGHLLYMKSWSLWTPIIFQFGVIPFLFIGCWDFLLKQKMGIISFPFLKFSSFKFQDNLTERTRSPGCHYRFRISSLNISYKKLQHYGFTCILCERICELSITVKTGYWTAVSGQRGPFCTYCHLLYLGGS